MDTLHPSTLHRLCVKKDHPNWVHLGGPVKGSMQAGANPSPQLYHQLANLELV